MLSLVLSAVAPEAVAALKGVQATDTAVVDVCTQAVVMIATKGQGCTKDIRWYNAGKAHEETSTGALPGSIDMVKGADDWLSLAINFLAP